MTTIKNKILEALKISPNAELLDSRTTTQKEFKILWRPHNYRRQIKVKEKDNSTIQNIKSAIDTFLSDTKISINSHTKVITIKGFRGTIIQYGRTNLTAILAQQKRGKYKQTYLIKSNDLEEIDKRIEEISNQFIDKLDQALLDFSRHFNINLPTERPKDTRGRGEEWIRGEDFIDNLPRDLIIHDNVFKKVYEKGIEFIGDKTQNSTSRLRNYIRNRAIENVAPQIEDKLEIMDKRISGLQDGLEPTIKRFAAQIELHLNVLEGINKSFERFNLLLQKQENTPPEVILSRINDLGDLKKEEQEIARLDEKQKRKFTELLLKKFSL